MSKEATNIDIEVVGANLFLDAPYNKQANEDYKGLAGVWHRPSRRWKFAAKDLEEVRALLRLYFGYDDRPVEMVTARVELHGLYDRGERELRWFDRVVAHRPGRDEPVELTYGVRVVKGAFRRSAGSVQYPCLGDVSGIVLEVRKVPHDHPDLELEDVTVLETGNEVDPAVRRAELETERIDLHARLAVVEAELKDLE